jgi:hypothetical protein
MAERGKARSSAFSSCGQTTSGCAVANQSRRLAKRLLTLLMLKVAIRIVYPRSSKACSTSWISGA